MRLSRSNLVNTLLVWLPVTIGILLTVSVVTLLHLKNQRDDQVHIALLAKQAEEIIKERFEKYEFGLRGARGAIVAVGHNAITRQQFEHYINTRDIPKEFPGALGFGFIRRVPVAEEGSFVEAVRADGAENFSIRTLTPHNGDRFVIQYIYPIASNKQALGLDIGSERNRRNAAISSARENRAYLTEPITLVQADNKSRRGVLILLPVFPKGYVSNSPDLREQQVVGWSYAPLIIDDVLADLHKVMSEAKIQLRNKNEPTPFYISDAGELNYQPKEKVTRTINVMGQTWLLDLVPSNVIYRTDRWDVNWVLGVGLAFTFILVLAISFFRSNVIYDDGEEDRIPNGVKSFFMFFRSPVFKRTWPPAIVVMLIVFFVVIWLLMEKNKENIANQLVRSNVNVMSILSEIKSQHSRDILFLANNPPVMALKSIQFQNVSVVDGSSEKQWQSRLVDIFKAYMLTSEEVFQVRLITVEKGWKEQVKVQRDGQILKVFDESELQYKSAEPYVINTFDVGAHNVYISDVNLNREYGEIEVPSRPVWRFSTPLFFEDGTPYGLIVVNLNAGGILGRISQEDTYFISNYLTNDTGQYILHPDLDRTFSFEKGGSIRWGDEYQLSSSGLFEVSGTKEFEGENGKVWVIESKLPLESPPSSRFIFMYTVMPQLPFVIQIVWQIIVIGLGILSIAVISGIIQYWLWLSSLVAEKDKWSRQLQEQQAKELIRFKALLESSPEATFIVDRRGVVKMVNDEAISMFGLPREKIEDHSVEQLLPPDLREKHNLYADAYVKKPKNRRMDATRQLFALRANGDEFPVEISLSAVTMDDELLVTVSIRDITERLRTEQQLKVALQEAEKATQAKSAFLANTSHEIRTPLNAIIGLTHLLTNEKLTTTQRLLVDKIYLSGKSLLGIVNDVLDLSKIEADEMTLELLPVELRNFLDEICGVFAIQAEQKQLEFILSLTSDLPDWIEADAVRLQQIIVNLLSNALKFTTIGSINLTAEFKASIVENDQAKSIVRFSVHDTGIGISKDVQSRLFKPFSQADVSTTRRYGGTGLGLSIVSRLVKLMGGDIGVDSAEGKGATFWVDIPFSTPLVDSIESELLSNHQSLYLIAAEDNKEDATHLLSLTRSLGWRTDMVSSGEALVELYISRQEKGLRLPDAIVVDWQMPNLDGIRAIEQLVSHVGEGQLPAVLMLSAFEKQKIQASDTHNSIDTILQKPVTASGIFNAVNNAVSRHSGNSERVLSATMTERINAKWLSNAQILVVDDSETNLEVASYMLERVGAVVDTANSGAIAIDKLKDNAVNYDAVLMDVQMPDMDGLDTTRYIRQTLEMTYLPIIALTAGALVDERRRALAAGMNDFLTKPISPPLLISVLRKQISNYTGKVIEVQELNTLQESTDDWPMIEGLDSTQARELLMDSKSLFFNTLKHLLEDNSNLLSDETMDVDSPGKVELRLSLAGQIHKLRSAAGMIGSQKIHSLASSAEDILRESRTNAKEVLSALSAELKKLKIASKEEVLMWDSRSKDVPVLTGVPKDVSIETAKSLLKMLREQDLMALQVIDEQKNYLYRLLEPENFDLLLDSVNRLNFKQAENILASFLQPTGKNDE